MGKTIMYRGSDYSSWQVLSAANSFYELSNFLTDKLPRTMEEVNRMKLSMDDAAASATNRILAVELYLKALLVGNNQLFPNKHDLKDLFDTLPQETQKTIKHHFDERSKLDCAHEVAWDLRIDFQLGRELDDNPPQDARRVVRTDPSLSGLLIRNRHGFVASRYLFQSAKHGELSVYYYEYKRLAILCSVLCNALENSLPNRSPTYRRGFRFFPAWSELNG